MAVSAFGDTANDERKQIELRIGNQTFAHYVYKDPVISRPSFCNVKTPRGMQVTRNHPVQRGDKGDHPTMHPGIWLSFGDLDGHDFWRLKAATEHVRFVEDLKSESIDHQTFTVENAYQSTDGKTLVSSEI